MWVDEESKQSVWEDEESEQSVWQEYEVDVFAAMKNSLIPVMDDDSSYNCLLEKSRIEDEQIKSFMKQKPREEFLIQPEA